MHRGLITSERQQRCEQWRRERDREMITIVGLLRPLRPWSATLPIHPSDRHLLRSFYAKRKERNGILMTQEVGRSWHPIHVRRMEKLHFTSLGPRCRSTGCACVVCVYVCVLNAAIERQRVFKKTRMASQEVVMYGRRVVTATGKRKEERKEEGRRRRRRHLLSPDHSHKGLHAERNEFEEKEKEKGQGDASAELS